MKKIIIWLLISTTSFASVKLPVKIKIIYDQWVNGDLVDMNNQFYFVADGGTLYNIDKTIVKEIYYKDRLVSPDKIKTIKFEDYRKKSRVNIVTINEKYAWGRADKSKFISKQSEYLMGASQALKGAGWSYLLGMSLSCIGVVLFSKGENTSGLACIIFSFICNIVHAAKLISTGDKIDDYVKQIEIVAPDSAAHSTDANPIIF